MGEPIEEFSELGWDKVMDLNVKSMFFVTEIFTFIKERIYQRKSSQVINIGSIDGINTPAFENLCLQCI